MKRILKEMLIATFVTSVAGSAMTSYGHAQTAALGDPAVAPDAPVVLPPVGLPDPTVGLPPAGVQETYDQDAAEQRDYLIELQRQAVGRLGGLYGTAEDGNAILGQQRVLLDDQRIILEDQRAISEVQRDAVIGTRPVASPNVLAPAQTGGGPGLLEMATARGGALPPDAADALTRLTPLYNLNEAFDLSTDPALSEQMIGHAAAQSAVASATAESSYKRANASMGRLDQYVASLQASTDLKTSVDLNTRVMIELAQQSNEQLRTQAAIASVLSIYFMAVGGDNADEDEFFDFTDWNRRR